MYPESTLQTRCLDDARAAAAAGDPALAKAMARAVARKLPGNKFESIQAILRHVPKAAPIPTKIAFGELDISLTLPNAHFDCVYDPLRAILGDPFVPEYLMDNDTESSGSITSSILPAAGYGHKVRGIRVKYDPDPDQSGADDAREVITLNPEHLNVDLVGATQTTTTSELTLGDVTEAVNEYRFSLPATESGGIFVLFGSREAGLGRTIPIRAMISQDIASPGELVAGDRTIAPVTSLLVSGNLMRKTTSVLGPALPYWEEFVFTYLSNCYDPL